MINGFKWLNRPEVALREVAAARRMPASRIVTLPAHAFLRYDLLVWHYQGEDTPLREHLLWLARQMVGRWPQEDLPQVLDLVESYCRGEATDEDMATQFEVNSRIEYLETGQSAYWTCYWATQQPAWYAATHAALSAYPWLTWEVMLTDLAGRLQ